MIVNHVAFEVDLRPNAEYQDDQTNVEKLPARRGLSTAPRQPTLEKESLQYFIIS